MGFKNFLWLLLLAALWGPSFLFIKIAVSDFPPFTLVAGRVGLAAGIRLIHHCDGDIRPVVDDFIRIGFSGLQGFQYELGVDLYDLCQKRSLRGEPLLFFTGMSVSRTLPLGTLEDVRDEIDYFLDATDGGRGMFLFTSNVTGVEVPPDNLLFAYRYLKGDAWKRRRESRWRTWPWHAKPGRM